MQVTKNFNEIEMSCPCCGALVYEQSFIDHLQLLRDILQIAFIIKPGGFYRCRYYNDSLPGGAPTSQHLRGRAADIKISSWSSFSKWKFIKESANLGLSLGFYSHHFHIDKRIGNPKTWYGVYS